MTQISRPFQIVLVVFALFVCVWFVALRAHSSGTTGGSGASASGSSAPASSPALASSGAAKAKVAAPARTTRVSHGASAVTGKRSASTAAGHAAVVHTTIVTKHAAPAKSAPRTTVVHSTVVTHTPTAKPAPTVRPALKTTAAAGAPRMQVAVEHELQQGKTVLILFWNPRGADDVAVHRELPAVQHTLGAKIAVNYASASQVGEFGTITHSVQVTQTPTLLIVNRHGQTTELTGLTDAFSVEQLVGESGA